MSTSKTVAAAAIGLMLVVGSTAAETTLESVRAKAAAGSSTEALAELERLLAERPRQPEALFLKGVLLGEAGRTAEAREVFEELIRLRPDLPEPYNNLAVIQASAGDYEAAVETLKSALGTHASYRTAYDNLTKIYGQLASEAYSRALASGNTPQRQVVELVLLGSMAVPAARERAAPAGRPVAVEPLPPVVAAVENLPGEAPAAAASDPEPVAEAVAAEPEAAVEPAGGEVAEAASSEAAMAAAAEELMDEVTAEMEMMEEAAAAAAAAPEEAMAEDAMAAEGGEPAAPEPPANEVMALVEAWSTAWSEQRADDYLAFYGADFTPAGGMSRAEWEDLRRVRLEAPEWIKVSVAYLDSAPPSGDRASVTFIQSYESNTFSDVVTKRLELAREDGEWKIREEVVEP